MTCFMMLPKVDVKFRLSSEILASKTSGVSLTRLPCLLLWPAGHASVMEATVQGFRAYARSLRRPVDCQGLSGLVRLPRLPLRGSFGTLECCCSARSLQGSQHSYETDASIPVPRSGPYMKRDVFGSPYRFTSPSATKTTTIVVSTKSVKFRATTLLDNCL